MERRTEKQRPGQTPQSATTSPATSTASTVTNEDDEEEERNRENRSVPTSPELAEYYTNSLLDHGSAAASHSDTSQYTSLVAKDTSPLRGNTRRTTSSSSTFPPSPPELSRSANRSDEDTTQRAPTSASAPAPRAVPRLLRNEAACKLAGVPEVMFGRLRVVGEADDEGSFAYSQSSANESEWSNYDDTDQDYSDSDGLAQRHELKSLSSAKSTRACTAAREGVTLEHLPQVLASCTTTGVGQAAVEIIPLGP